MKNAFRLAVAFAAGAAVMYYFDPLVGRSRRGLVRDRGLAAGHDAGAFLRARTRRATDRLQGVVAATRARFADETLGDQRLHERIRARLGRLVDQPDAVQVEVLAGHVILSGRASADEIDDLVDALATMRGVEGVDNRLSSGEGSMGATGWQDARH